MMGPTSLTAQSPLQAAALASSQPSGTTFISTLLAGALQPAIRADSKLVMSTQNTVNVSIPYCRHSQPAMLLCFKMGFKG